MNTKNFQIRFCNANHVIATEQSGLNGKTIRVGAIRSFNKHYAYYDLVASTGKHCQFTGNFTTSNQKNDTALVASACDCIARALGSKAYKKHVRALKTLKAENQNLKQALAKNQKELNGYGMKKHI